MAIQPAFSTVCHHQKAFRISLLINTDDALFLGSLTLGGYDSSRYVANNLSFVFSPDNERDLVVGLAGLSANTTTQSNIGLLKQTDVTLYIDSTVAEIWLPPKSVQRSRMHSAWFMTTLPNFTL